MNKIKLEILKWVDVARTIRELQDDVYKIIDDLRTQLDKGEEITIKDWTKYKHIPIKDKDINNINSLCDALGVEFDFTRKDKCQEPNDKEMTRSKIESRVNSIKEYNQRMVDYSNKVKRDYSSTGKSDNSGGDDECF